MKKRIIMLFLILGLATVSNATQLVWDSNDQSAEYVVYYRKSGDTAWTAIGAPQTATSITLPAMPEYNTTYELSVRGFNEYGNSSDYSAPVTYNQGRCESVISAVKNVRLVIDMRVPVDSGSGGR